MDDSIYRLRYRDLLAICVLALLGLGVIMVQSAASGVSGDLSWHWSKTGTRDVIYVALAVIAFIVVGHLDYRLLLGGLGRRKREVQIPETPGPILNYASPAPTIASRLRELLRNPIIWIYLVGVLLCAATLVIGKSVNGARRWLVLGPVQLQASEAGKWACVLLFSWILSLRPLDLNRFKNLIIALLPLGVVGLLVVKEDFGTAALIGVCILGMLFAGRARMWQLLLMLPPLAAGAVYFICKEPYRMKRIMAFRDPFASPKEEGYHLIQSLLSFASGGVPGRGLGNGVQKLGYLPEDTTDFIFAIICEELGLFGAMLTVALYLGLIWACWSIVRQTRNGFGQTLAFGVGLMIGLQAMINIAVATVSVPPKGLPLPLVSFGGTGLVITSMMLGLVYSVARIAEREQASSGLPLMAKAVQA